MVHGPIRDRMYLSPYYRWVHGPIRDRIYLSPYYRWIHGHSPLTTGGSMVLLEIGFTCLLTTGGSMVLLEIARSHYLHSLRVLEDIICDILT